MSTARISARLLLTFFHRQMPEIVKAGHLFIAQPPLFKVAKGRSEVYLKDQPALDRYLVDAGLQGRVLETQGGARSGEDLRILVEQALRFRNLLGFVPRRYDFDLVEQMALSGALDPALSTDTRAASLDFTASRIQMGDSEAKWSARLLDDGSVQFSRLWRGVTDVHDIDARFLESTEALKLHGLAGPQAETYAAPVRLVKAAEAVDDSPATASDEDAEGEEPATIRERCDHAPNTIARRGVRRRAQGPLGPALQGPWRDERRAIVGDHARSGKPRAAAGEGRGCRRDRRDLHPPDGRCGRTAPRIHPGQRA
jgi:hypothetical protein